MTVEVDLTPIQFNYADGRRLEIYADVTNTGNSQVTDTIELSVDNTTRDSRDVTLNSGERTYVKLAWNVSTSSDTTVPLSVSSKDETASEQITLKVHNDKIEVNIAETQFTEQYIA